MPESSGAYLSNHRLYDFIPLAGLVYVVSYSQYNTTGESLRKKIKGCIGLCS